MRTLKLSPPMINNTVYSKLIRMKVIKKLDIFSVHKRPGAQERAVDPRTPEYSGFEALTPELFWDWILFWD